MPSAKPLPTLAQMLRAKRTALIGERDRYGDPRSGALYDHVAGPMAVLLVREADGDADAFRAIYWDDAVGDDLTALIQGRTVSPAYPNGIERILDTYGQGTCKLGRTSAAAGAGTIWQGTRIAVPGNPPLEYQVIGNPQAGSATTAMTVNVQALKIGSGSAISTGNGLFFEDEVYDPLWTPLFLQCADGTDYEEAAAYRARARTLLAQQRNGYLTRLQQVAQSVGAFYVIGIASNQGLAVDDFADDGGVSAVYVADQNYAATPAMINAVTVALESCRVLGCDLWVGGVARTALQVQAVLNLVDDPGRLDLVPITRAATQALLAAFGPTGGGYVYKRAELQGALAQAHGAIQNAAIPYSWEADTEYAAGDTVFPTPANGFIYQAAVGGTSGASQPSFTTVAGNSTQDGEVVWVTTPYSPGLGIYQAGVRQTADPTITAATFTEDLPRYVLAPRDIILSFAGPV